MLNSVPLKGADVVKWEQNFLKMKNRRNIVLPGSNTTGGIPEEMQGITFASSTADQKLEGINTHTTPQSRDGHTGIIFKGLLIIFGGDRHHMPFNDTYVFDLATELRQRNLVVTQE